ncbi:flagellar hook capping FlgD N-terminal domain-containing protein [Falsirhodobacter deserti]|uniref:flagellar hook capping FlgD N-terminal domain-containing protein n=1 Tax=Falsirhodobacter deserti TaxID=1365611 RepID=UPI000FE41C9E|nr:flagellar hook capping FlgD N-terminal domain-containing protein [Falsirhodobacter deserti]
MSITPAASGLKPDTNYQTFLTMLTTQMRNQDPTSPMESSDFAVQLATFSGVEQQTRTNELIEGLGAKLDALTLSDLSSWLGAQALVDAPVPVDGSTITLFPETAANADGAVLVVKDASGKVVSRTDIAPGAQSVEWVPADQAGTPLTAGRYTLGVESYLGQTMISTGPARHYATVAEARNDASGTILVMKGGAEVPAGQVAALKR